MAKTSASPGKEDFTNITSDVLAAVDNTYDLGSLSKRWKQLFVVTALITSMVIGNNIGLSNVDGILFINASAVINRSLNVTGNITAANFISTTGQSLGDNSSWNETLADTLYTPASFNRTLADSLYLNLTGGTMTGNTTMGDNLRTCYGTAGCSDSSIYFNGSALIIEVN